MYKVNHVKKKVKEVIQWVPLDLYIKVQQTDSAWQIHELKCSHEVRKKKMEHEQGPKQITISRKSQKKYQILCPLWRYCIVCIDSFVCGYVSQVHNRIYPALKKGGGDIVLFFLLHMESVHHLCKWEGYYPLFHVREECCL